MDNNLVFGINKAGKREKSIFAISKSWLYILPFILIPFCAIPNLILNKLQYQDLARIYFSFIGGLYLITLRKSAIHTAKVLIIVAFAFITSNLISVIGASLKYDTNGISSSIKLFGQFIIFILIPLCGIKYTIKKLDEKHLYQFYLIPIAIVIIVSIIQIMAVLGLNNVITNLYLSEMYKYVEGSWTGIADNISNAIWEFRIVGTFHEPSVLATFLLLYSFPFVFSRYLNGVYSFNKSIDLLFVVLPVISLIFSFSTTSYVLMSIDIFIFILLYMQKKSSPKKYVILFIFCIGVIIFLINNFETYFRIVSRAFLTNNLSTSSRLGSIFGAISMFWDNPLGVGFSNEKYLVYNFLPAWGKTAETTLARSNIYSVFFKYLAAFGIFWLLFCFSMFAIIIKYYKKSRIHLCKWQRDAFLIWIINLLFSFTFGFIEYQNQWFLLSTVIILGPILKRYE